MSDLIFGVKLNGDGTLTGEAKAASAAMQDLAASTQKAASQADQLNTSQKATALTMTQIAEGQMHMSIAESNATDKAWALANGYKEVNGQMVKNTAAVLENAGAHGTNAIAIRESLVMVREAANGNFTRMAGSASILANVLSGPVLAVVGAVSAAVAVGAAAWESYGSNVGKVREEMDKIDGDIALNTLTELNKRFDEYGKLAEDARTKSSSGGWGWLQASKDAALYTEEQRKIGTQIDANRKKETEMGDAGGVAFKLALQSSAQRRENMVSDLKALETYYNAQQSGSHAALMAMSAIDDLQKKLADKPSIDPNANTVLSLQNELYKQQALAMGFSAHDLIVLDLARKNANETDLLAAGIAASRLDQIDAENAASQDLLKTRTEIEKQGQSEIDALYKAAAAQQLHNAEIGKTPEQISLVKAAMAEQAALQDQSDADYLAGVIARDQADADWMAANPGVLAIYQARQQALQGIATAQQNLNISQQQGAANDAVAAATQKTQEAFKKASDSIYRTLTDALMRAFETGHGFAQAFADTLVNMFKSMILAPTIQFMLAPITGAISAAMLPGTAAAATAAAPGGMGSFLNAGTAIKSGYDAFTGGLSNAYYSAATSSAGSAMGLSSGSAMAGDLHLTSAGSMLGTGLGYAGAGLAGIGLGSAIAGNKTVVGLDGTSIAAIGTAVGAIWGPVGMIAGGVIGGAIDAAFGSGPKVSGATTLAGKFSQGGFAGQYETPWSKSGGLFSSGSSGIDTAALDSTQQSALQNMVAGTTSVFDKLLSTTGEANKSLTGWTFAVNQQVNTADQQKQLTIDLATSMGNYLIPALAQFQKTGENLADTAVRMTDEFVLTDTAVQMMGKDSTTAFGAIGLASAAARDNLVTLMGGVSAMSSTVQSYYTNFYTDSQRHANDLKTLTAQFAALGVAMPTTSAGFRSLVESQDLSTASGQQMYASLMGMNGAFAALFGTMQSVSAAADAANAKLQALIKPDSFATSLAYTMALASAIAPASTTGTKPPGFASGGDFGGGMRIVGENGPEMEFTGPSRITNNGDSKKLFDTSALEAKIEALYAEVARLRSSNEDTARSSRKVSDLLRRVTQDGNSLLTTPA